MHKKNAFTLVELIVVITILAILGTIAFIALEGYSAQARDSKRLSDISNIKKSVELFSLNTGKYPLADNYFTVSYSGEKARHQGIVGEQVTTNLSRNLQKKPTDPLTGLEYTYSTTHYQTEYEILSLYESDLIGINKFKSPFVASAKKGIFSTTNAETQDYPKIDGNYNGIYVKTSNFYVPTPSIINGDIFEHTDFYNNGTFLKSQIITGGNNIPGINTGLLDINLSDYEGTITSESTDEQKSSLVEAIQTAYSGSQLASNTTYADILSRTTTSEMTDFVDIVVLKITEYNTSSNNEGGENITSLITSTDCTDAGWYWVDPSYDTEATTTISDGYCISSRIEGNGDNYGISWNDVGTTATWYEWDTTGYGTLEGLANDLRGITAYLSDYTCGGLNSGHTDILDYGDTIKGRMKWISQFANIDNNYSDLNSIDWIDIDLNTSNIFPIPSIYIADCIDGQKDLTTSMTLGEETISWEDYISTVNTNDTRIDRNKYLLGWTKSSGSHLPSAFSSMTYETLNNLEGEARGEYQVAYENNTSIGGDFISDSSNEFIWTSALGRVDGSGWGRFVRQISAQGQTYNTSGHRNTPFSARFVVRP